MLNIFRGKVTSPNYRLAAPPGGELQSLTAKKEVRFSFWDYQDIFQAKHVEDTANSSICIWGYPS